VIAIIRHLYGVFESCILYYISERMLIWGVYLKYFICIKFINTVYTLSHVTVFKPITVSL
jgi:hypothetical protein